MTSQEAGKLVALLTTNYDVPAWPEERIRMFITALKNLPHDVGRQAVEDYIGSAKSRPVIADILALAVRDELPGPEQACGMLFSAFGAGDNRTSWYDLPDAVLTALSHTGQTFETLRMMQEREYPFFKNQFKAAYREVHDRIAAPERQRLMALPGGRAKRQLTDGRSE